MAKWGAVLVGTGALLFAVFSQSSTYQLKSYSVGPGGTNNASSSTYSLQGSAGEQANGVTSGSTHAAQNGSIPTGGLNVPPAPTLSNGGGTFYNQLNCLINTGSNPTDATYAIAVSANNFVTTSYVQSNGTLGALQVYQTYTQWGGSGGSPIVGLAPNTTYEVKVAAKEGKFSNTVFGAYATASTVSTAITFSLSPSSASLGPFVSGSVVTSSNLSFAYTTNAAAGGSIYMKGQNSGLKSARYGYTISAFSGNLAGQAQGFGMQASNARQTSGGPLTIISPFNGAGNTVGAESTTFSPIFSTAAPIVGGTASAVVQAKASSTTPPSNDYQEVLTFIASASF